MKLPALVLLSALATGLPQTVRGAESSKPPPGTTRVAKATPAAVDRQAEFCSRICAELSHASLQAREFRNPHISSAALLYRLFQPASPATNQLYPLVLFLHGGGADNDFNQLLNCASPFFAFCPARFTSAAEQARHPSFVLVPWSGGRGWQEENGQLIIALLEDLKREMPIDPHRIYVTGQSMGGYGTWRLLEKYPNVFAAGIAVCGGGEPALAARAKVLPIWVFHGTGDQIVPVMESRRIVAAFQQAGGKARYWEYEGEDHAGTARRAYCEPELTDWLFAQARR